MILFINQTVFLQWQDLVKIYSRANKSYVDVELEIMLRKSLSIISIIILLLCTKLTSQQGIAGSMMLLRCEGVRCAQVNRRTGTDRPELSHSLPHRVSVTSRPDRGARPGDQETRRPEGKLCGKIGKIWLHTFPPGRAWPGSDLEISPAERGVTWTVWSELETSDFPPPHRNWNCTVKATLSWWSMSFQHHQQHQHQEQQQQQDVIHSKAAHNTTHSTIKHRTFSPLNQPTAHCPLMLSLSLSLSVWGKLIEPSENGSVTWWRFWLELWSNKTLFVLLGTW